MADSQQQLMRDAVKQIKKLKQELSRYKKVRHEPIAVIGMGCRYPNGANNPELFWEKLANGEDCINQQANNERWDMDQFYDANPDAPGKINAKGLGIIDCVDAFDADFFGISPREAEDIDPQHRLLLEVSYETMENAGYAPAALSGTNTGVYVGMASSDYAHLGSILGSPEDITPWQGIGNAMSAAPGRLAYLFNLKGPALALDTACSSSLVALHSACNALRQHDCDQALAGGVHLLLNPAVSIVFAKARMLSPDGLCKTFDANADGYVRSEGCGMVMLKRLSDAEADGDHILALIKGSAINQDGKSQGITAPNETAQTSVIEQAIKHAGITPQDVSYVEAHGTGTPLGDPIEINALNAVYGKGRDRENPLLVGSVKTNIGHAEAASGMAGVIKLVQSLQHHTLPEHLHFQTPNPYIQWESMPIAVNCKAREWRSKDSLQNPLRAGVSAFAFTGTNAHVILEEYPNSTDSFQTAIEQSGWKPSLLVASAQKPQALDEYQQALLQFLDQQNELSFRELAHANATHKDHFKYRKAWLAKSTSALKSAWETGDNSIEMQGEKPKQPLKTAFLFSGVKSYRCGMAELLYKNIPEFKAHCDEVIAAFPSQISETLKQFIWNGGGVNVGESRCHYEFAAVFAIEVALTKTWVSWGLKPDCMMGVDVGEVVAAYIADICSLADACKLVMILADFVDHQASESSIAKAAAQLESIKFVKPKMRVLSGFTGKHLGGEMASSAYWARHATESMSLSACAEELKAQKINIAIEVGPGVRLVADVATVYDANKKNITAVACMPVSASELSGLEMALAKLYVAGVDFIWQKIFSGKANLPNSLPSYPFQRKPCWNQVLKRSIEGSSNDAKASSSEIQSASSLECLYQLSWKVNPKELQDTKVDTKWLLLFPTSFLVQEFAACLTCVGNGSVEKMVYDLNSGAFPSEEALLRLANGAMASTASTTACNIVFSTAQLNQSINSEQYPMLVEALLFLAKTVRKAPGLNLYLITENAIQLEDGEVAEAACDPLQAMLHGAAKSLALELPERFKLSVDIDSNQFDSVKACAELIQQGCKSPWVAIRNGKTYSPELVASSEQTHLATPTINDPSLNQPSFTANGFYLIAGGTGAIGLSIAQWLVEQGVRHIVLLSRSGITSDSAIQTVERLGKEGVQVLAPKVDIANKVAVSKVLESLRQDRDICGVIHAAGVFDLEPIQDLTVAQCESVMASKVLGVQWLDQLTEHDPIECFIGFSSIASVWGSAGNFHYAAANQVVNAVIANRRHANKPGLVVNWGPWENSGMVSAESKQLAEKRGLKTLSHRQAIDLLAQLVNENLNDRVAADIQWEIFKPLMNLTTTGHLFKSVTINKPQSDTSLATSFEPNAEDLAFKAKISQCHASERESLLLEYLCLQLSRSLQIDPEDLDESQPMIDMGIDSLMAVEFKNRVMLITEAELPLVRLLNGASLKDVAAYLVNEQISEAIIADDADEIVEGVL